MAGGSRYDGTALGPNGRGPIPHATIAVLTQPANTSTTPGSPLATIYTDATLSTTTANPFQADVLGNFHFYADGSLGPFTVQVYGAQVQTPYALADQGMPSIAGSNLAVSKLDNIRIVDGITFTTIDTAIADLPAGGGVVIIPSTYAGPEVSTAATDPIAGYPESNTAANVTVIDLRGPNQTGGTFPVFPGPTGYNIAFNSFQQHEQSRLGVWQKVVPGTTWTTTAIEGVNEITTIIPSSDVQGLLGEAHTVGALTSNNGGGLKAVDGETHIWSTGQTLSAAIGVQGFAGITRAASTTNVTTLASLYAAAPTNVSTSGAVVTDAYGVIAQQPGAVGTRNNYSMFTGNLLLNDNSFIDVQNGTSAGEHVLQLRSSSQFPSQGLWYYGVPGGGTPIRLLNNNGHFNWLTGSNLSSNDSFEFTPSTAANGTTFTTPVLRLSRTGVDLYNGINTAGNGLVVVYGATSQKSETAADASVLSFTPPAAAGTYRINFVLSLSAANAATLGWTATWTDSNGAAQAPTNLSLSQSGTAAPALTFTTSLAGNYYGTAIVDVNNSATAIVVKLTFSGTSFSGKASATIERLQ